MSPYSLFFYPSKSGKSTPFFIYFFFSFSLLFLSVLCSSDPSDFVLQNVFEHKDQCFNESYIYVRASEVANLKSPPFFTYSTTRECAQRLREAKLPSELPSCPPGLVDLEVKPVYVPKSQISYPFANLNISVTAHSSVDTIAFRLECLSTSDGSDVYCSNSKAMHIDGVKEWPCRGIHVSSRVKYPIRFSYSCFRLTSHSTYAINATVLPQKCRVSNIVTAPNFDDLFPTLLVDPSINKSTIVSEDPYWAPMISVDLSDESGIWIHLGKAERAECDRMLVNVYREHEDNAQKVTFMETLTIKCPQTSLKWENQLAGRYLLTAYVPIRGCKFMCDSKSERGCRQCLRTHLNLLILQNRASVVWMAVRKMKDLSFEIFVGSISILAIIGVIMLIVLLIALRRRRRETQRVREIQLSNYVKTMIVYSDDNDHHTNCVRILVDYLRNCATCQPVLDLEQLVSTEQIVPSRWLVDQLSSLSKFIIVMSDCAQKMLDTEESETHQLAQTRPFPDLFGPAIEMIIRDCTRNSMEARKKYAIVRFAYSPKVPPNLAILHLPVFNLPHQFGHLTAFLHDLEHSEQMSISQNLSPTRIDDWNIAISQHFRFSAENPDWIHSRWRPKDELDVIQFKRQSPVILKLETNEDRENAAEMYGLEPPGGEDSDDDMDNPNNQFIFYERDEIDSDTESDDSEDRRRILHR